MSQFRLFEINSRKTVFRFFSLIILGFVAAVFTACSKAGSSAQVKISADTFNPDGRLLFSMDFDSYPGAYEPYTQSMLRNDFNAPGVILGSRASGEIRGIDSDSKTWPARNAAGRGHLRADFPANIASGKESGFLFDLRLPDMDVSTMEYKVKFDNNFIYAAGGKLPGLGGAADGAGIPVGCTKNENNIRNGFSARLMWRRDGRLVVYSYFPDRKKNCGEDIPFFTVKAGEWYKIKQSIKLNTPGVKDGTIKIYVNDQLAFTKDDLLFREAGKSDVKINAAVFHTYRGGKATDQRFHSSRREFIYFDDFKIWQGFND